MGSKYDTSEMLLLSHNFSKTLITTLKCMVKKKITIHTVCLLFSDFLCNIETFKWPGHQMGNLLQTGLKHSYSHLVSVPGVMPALFV